MGRTEMHQDLEPRADDDAAEHGARLRAVLDGLFAFAGVMTPDGVLLEANQPALDEAGITRADVVGKPFWEAWWWSYDPAVQARVREAVARAAAGEAVRYDADVRMSGGRLMTIDFMLAPVFDRDGRVTHLVPSAIDITDRKRVERSLAESERSLREVMESLPSIVWTATPEGRVDNVNRRLAELCGAEAAREVLAATNPTRLGHVHPDDRPGFQAAWRAAVETGAELRAEHRLRLADGDHRWMLSRAVPLRNAEGRIVRWFGTTTDIEDQKRVQDELRDSRERLVAALDASRTGTFRFDLGTGEIEADARLSRLLGEAPLATAVPLARFLARVHPEDRGALRETIEAAADGAADASFAFRSLRPDGEVRWIEGKGRAIAGPDGRPVAIAGACTDITERRRAREVARQNELLQTLVDSIPVMLVFYDAEGRIQVVNRAFEERMGWTNGAALVAAQPIEALQREAAADAPGEPRRPQWRDLEARTRAGDALPSSWADVPLSDGSRIGIGIDLRERHALEAQRETLLAELRDERERLRERNEQLRRLTLRLSAAEHQERRRIAHTLHDHFQQLLVAAKMGVAQLRRLATADDAGDGGSEAIDAAAGRVRDLIGEVIEGSRTLAVELSPPVLYDHGLAASLRWLADHFGTRHGLDVIVDADEAADPADVEVQAFLFQSVRELLLNVRKHADVDEARVTLRRGDGDTVEIRVADEGRGCAEADALVADGEPGGFGLYSIRRRIELVGGRFDFASESGGGCAVCLSVPLAALGDGSRPAPPRLVPAGVGRTETPPVSRAVVRVVIADDHTIVRQGLVTLFEDEPDIEVVAEARDGEEAVAEALRRRPDVVLMDVSMPRVGGVEATRRILEALPETRVVGLSMHDDVETNRAMLEAGAAAYLQKGGPVEDLVALVRGV